MDLLRLSILGGVAIANVTVALVVILRNKKNPANRAFTGAVFAIVLWLCLDFLGDQQMLVAQAEVLKRLTLATGMLMGSLLLYFAIVFPTQERKPTWPAWLYFSLSAVLMTVTSTTRLVQASAAVTSAGTTVTFGPLMPVFAAWAVSGIVAMVWMLFRKYRRADGRSKAQLLYMLTGAALFAASAIAFGLLGPLVTGSSWLAHLVPVSTLLLVGYTAYAIVKHRLLDVRLVVWRSVVYTVMVAFVGALMIAPAVLVRSRALLANRADENLLFMAFGLAAVFAFQPVRSALERATDRFLYRGTYDPDKLLNQLGTSMSTTLDIDDLGSLLALRLAETMRLSFAAAAYLHAEIPMAVGTGVVLNEPEVRKILGLCRSGSILVADDLDHESACAAHLAEHQIRVLVPLVMDREVFGALILGPKASGEMYTSQDLKVLDILGPEASIAMRNARLFDEKNQRVRELTALNELAYALGANIELESVLEAAMEQLVAVTQADSGSIMLLETEDMRLRIAASLGLPPAVVDGTCQRVGEGVAGWVAKTREPLILVDDTDPRFRRDLRRSEVISAISAPIICKDEVIGVLNVNRGVLGDIFTRENLNVVTSFAGQMAVVIENARLYRDLENTILGTITALAAAVDAKDPYTYGHSRDVTEYCLDVAGRMHLDDAGVQTLRIAATLHDIGKIGIDGAILNKPGRLAPDELDAMRRHPAIGADILASLDFLREAVPLILFHHERFSGGGYPSGISGDAIPLGARIITVADSYNAMTSNRPYRDAMSAEEAKRELLDNAGTQFDPAVVAAFIEMLEDRAGTPSPEDGHSLPAVVDRGRRARPS